MPNLDTINLRELKTLISSLEALRDNGGKMNKRWIDPDGLESSLRHEEAHNLATAKSALQRVRSLETSLGTLTNLSSKISIMASTLRSLAEPIIRHHGLMSLPNETLAHIRTCLADLNNPGSPEVWMPKFRRSKSFPLVCRKFRQLELSMPSLWTYITDRMSTEVMKQYIDRSGNLGIKVYLSYTYWLRDSDKSDILFGTLHRWSHLCIYRLDSLDALFRSQLERVELPSLREFYIDTRSDEVNALIGTWRLPRLHAVSVSKVESAQALKLTDRNGMRRLKFAYRSSERISLESILGYLSTISASQITELELGFTYQKLEPSEGINSHYDDISLPMVEMLRIKCISYSDARKFGDMLFHVLSAIKFPNLKVVEFELSEEAVLHGKKFTPWLSSLRQSSSESSLRVATARFPPNSVEVEAQMFKSLRNSGCHQIKMSTGDEKTVRVRIEEERNIIPSTASFAWSITGSSVL